MKTPEEIKKGLECCTAPMLAHDSCPYKADRNPFEVICKDRVMEDALALIHQLETRLVEANKTSDDLRVKLAEYEKPLVPLPLDDILKLDDTGDAWWVEYKGGNLTPTILTNDCHQYGEQILHGYVLKLYDYGKTWRCWARKPTDEERKAAKWDD